MTISTFETAEKIYGRGKKENPKDCELKIRLTQSEKDGIQIAADNREISMSELIKNALDWYLMGGKNETSKRIFNK